jgi:hypothetical protein
MEYEGRNEERRGFKKRGQNKGKFYCTRFEAVGAELM